MHVSLVSSKMSKKIKLLAITSVIMVTFALGCSKPADNPTPNKGGTNVGNTKEPDATLSTETPKPTESVDVKKENEKLCSQFTFKVGQRTVPARASLILKEKLSVIVPAISQYSDGQSSEYQMTDQKDGKLNRSVSYSIEPFNVFSQHHVNTLEDAFKIIFTKEGLVFFSRASNSFDATHGMDPTGVTYEIIKNYYGLEVLKFEGTVKVKVNELLNPKGEYYVNGFVVLKEHKAYSDSEEDYTYPILFIAKDIDASEKDKNEIRDNMQIMMNYLYFNEE